MLQKGFNIFKMSNKSLALLGLIGLSGFILTGVAVFVIVVLFSSWWGKPLDVFGLGDGPDQPIAFPHTVHVEQLGMDCTFCHRTVTKSESAGIPPVQQCMFCHQTIGDGLPEIEKLRGFFERGEPINWQRVHRLPDHVQFVHEAHIKFFSEQDSVSPSEVCSTCHGDVGSMKKVKQVRSLKMGDCVNCHKDFNAPTDCATCHY